MKTVLLQWLPLILLGFCSGSVMFSYYIPQRWKHVDICADSDDGNPGSANVFLQCGWRIGLVCVFLDLLKGFWPVFVAVQTLDVDHPLFAVLMAAPVFGHAVAPFQRIAGGKCIATSFGVMAATFPYSGIGWILTALYIFFSTVVRLKPMWRRSITVFTLFGLSAISAAVYEGTYALGLGCIVISCIVIVKHLNMAHLFGSHFSAE